MSMPHSLQVGAPSWAFLGALDETGSLALAAAGGGAGAAAAVAITSGAAPFNFR